MVLPALASTPTTTSVPTTTIAPVTTTTSPPTTTTTADSVPTETAPPETSTSTTAPEAQPPASVAPGTGSRDLIGREGWVAAPVSAGLVSHTIVQLTVHHTAGAYTDNTQSPGRLRGFQAFHQEQGWPDLAYHHVLDRNGNIYEARTTAAKGDTFTNYDPAGHYLVVCDGDFTQQTPTDAQVSALVDMLAWASAQFGVSPETIGTHRDHAATACPGDGLGNLVDNGSLQAQVEARLAAGGTTLRVLGGQDAIDRVAAIEAGQA